MRLWPASGAGIDERGNETSFGKYAHSGMGVAVGDVENDGDLDLYITDFGPGPLYRSNGDGTFRMQSRSVGLDPGLVTWGCTFADFDLDDAVFQKLGHGWGITG